MSNVLLMVILGVNTHFFILAKKWQPIPKCRIHYTRMLTIMRLAFAKHTGIPITMFNVLQPSQLPSESVNLLNLVRLLDNMNAQYIRSKLKVCSLRGSYHVPHIVHSCPVELLQCCGHYSCSQLSPALGVFR